jgi:hypothetical protein
MQLYRYLWVSLVSFAAITLCVASQRVFIVVSFVIDSVRKFWIHTHIYIYIYIYIYVKHIFMLNLLAVDLLRHRFILMDYISCNEKVQAHCQSVKFRVVDDGKLYESYCSQILTRCFQTEHYHRHSVFIGSRLEFVCYLMNRKLRAHWATVIQGAVIRPPVGEPQG